MYNVYVKSHHFVDIYIFFNAERHTDPFEFVKSTLQLEQKKYGGQLWRFKDLVKQEGVLVLYRGSPAWFLFSFPKTAVRFASFERVYRSLDNNYTDLSPKIVYVLSGIIAGIVEAVLCLAPMQNLSLKMTHEAALRQKRYSRKFLPGAWRIAKESGVRGMLRGAGPLCIKNSINQAIRFPTFYWLSSKVKDRKKGKDPNLLEMMLCGGAAGMISCVFSHPVDVIKTNMMGLRNKEFRNSFDCAQKILQRHGLFGFYAGLLPRICRVSLEVGLHFSLFESLSKVIQKAIG